MIDLKFCNSAEPLTTIRQLVEPILNLYFISITKQLSSGCHLSVVLNIHSCMQCPSVATRGVSPLRAGDSEHGQSWLCVRTTNNNSSHSSHTSSDYFEPALFQLWLKVLQSAWQRDGLISQKRVPNTAQCWHNIQQLICKFTVEPASSKHIDLTMWTYLYGCVPWKKLLIRVSPRQ